MSRKKKKTESKVDITSFLFNSQEGDKAKLKGKEEYVTISNDIEVQLINFIRRQGKVEKSKVYLWSKKRKITPASLYRALVNLERKGLIKKEFDESIEELVYIMK